MKQGTERTDNRPIPRTRDPQRLTLHFPPTIQTLYQPDPIHRIVLSEMTSQRKMRVELYSGRWSNYEMAISTWSHFEKYANIRMG